MPDRVRPNPPTRPDQADSLNLLRRLLDEPYLILSITALFWAGNAIAGKFAVGHVSPFLLTTLRWMIALAVLLPFSIGILRRDWPVIRKNLPYLAFCGAFGFTLFTNMLYLALNHTTAINAAIVQASMPLVVFALNFLIFSIRATWLQILGFVLTVIGVAITATNGNLFNLGGLSVNVGDLYMLLGILAYGIYSVALVRKPAIHWMSFITIPAIMAILASLPFTLWEASAGRMIWPDTQGWVVAVYTAIFPAIVSQIFWVRGLEIIGSNRGGVFINLVPIFASGLAVLLLGEDFRLHHAIALALVIAGVGMSQRSAKRGGSPA
jgi:drug/metabolite transporter (DMT)-like permease